MVERSMDDGVRSGRSGAQAVEVVERATKGVRPGRGKRDRLVVGTSEAEHLVASTE